MRLPAIRSNIARSFVAYILLAPIIGFAQSRTIEQKHNEQINRVVSVKNTREGLEIQFQSGKIQYKWNINNYVRDDVADGGDYQDNTDLWITGNKGDKYMLFFGFSGGAHCCWAVLQFNLQSGKYEGDHLGSMGPMGAIGGNKKCPFRIRTVLFIEKYAFSSNPPQQTYCFEDGKFRLLKTHYFKPRQ